MEYARFADTLYQQYAERIGSEEWRTTEDALTEKRKQLAILEGSVSGSRDGLRRTAGTVKMNQLEREIRLLEQEVIHVKTEREKFFEIALKQYVDTLCLCSKYDVSAIFRLCALFFDGATMPQEAVALSESMRRVPPAKLLPLLYQIATRLGVTSESVPRRSGSGAAVFNAQFPQLVYETVQRVAQEHPQQALWILLALVHGDTTARSGRLKAQGAQTLVEATRVRHPALVEELELLYQGYQELATSVLLPSPATSATGTGAGTATRGMRSVGGQTGEMTRILARIGRMEHVCVPTAFKHTQPVGAAVPRVASFSRVFALVGGINRPKRLTCLGTDGRAYVQLVKAKDDLRQDSVIEQVFDVVNGLLARCSSVHSAERRALAIRTYNVIPLSPTSGLVEWVTNTLPIGDWLCGRPRSGGVNGGGGANGGGAGDTADLEGGAHARYRPRDWSCAACMRAMGEVQRRPAEERRRAYAAVCAHFGPVFHHFFLERFGGARAWLARRLCYTRSCAASSVVGYALGVGDRHTRNILVDAATAELVHIDLGVGFEQGRLLNTAELVPFRLTRDLVDAMGVAGTEGVFRLACEATLRVLRAHAPSLLTVLSVLTHDPPNRWTELQAATRDAASARTDAQRTLQRLRAKLGGTESGSPLSVEGQAAQLIVDATDPANLALMYHGWAAWV